MKSASNRIRIMWIFIALSLAGGVFLMFSIITQGGEWATSSRNAHLYVNGTLIGAGNITDSNGEILCATSDGKRSFHEDGEVRSALLHVVGDNHGYISSSIQNQYRTNLSGYNRIMGVWELCNFEQGSEVNLTVNAKACRVAYEALQGRKGAICVYNYKTGAVLVSVSAPTYDPENIPDDINDNEAYDGVYINRVTMGLYPPGSTFKVLTTAAAIDNLPGESDKTFYCDGAYHTSYGDVNCMGEHGDLQMKEALAKSCNTAYAEIANDVGAKSLQKTAENFGYNQKISLGKLGVYTSQIHTKKDDALELGWAGVGQSTTLVTPLLQVRIMGAIAGGGVPVEPYLVQKVTTASGFVKETAGVKKGSRSCSEETAAELKSLLRNNFEEQYGDWHFNEGLNPCGKSGTAETDPDKTPHAWFTGFLDNDEYPYAFVALVEEGGSGSEVALPVVAQVVNYLADAQ
ncbi:MAG: hypothetical protein IJJ41_02585 [Clostridia bacterium]|nr:hypothetical protein [Clostridia bacterium]